MNINGQLALENYFSFEETTEYELNQKNGFNYVKIENYILTINFQLMIEEIIKKYNLDLYDYSKNSYITEKKYFSDNIIITASGNSKDTAFNIYCKKEYDLNKIYKIYLKYSKEENENEVKGVFESLFIKGNGIDKTTKTINYKDLKDISEKYYPFLIHNKLFERFCAGNENILILLGSPGIGKTKFINLLFKFLIESPEFIPYNKLESLPELEEQFFNVCYVKSTDIICMDEFWRNLQKDLPDFVILDDLDYMLTKRDAEISTNEDYKKNAFLNQLLSFTDGVQKNKTKFIITTNQLFDDTDSAILRKGRIFNVLEFRELTKAEALDIWLSEGLPENEFKQIFVDANVLQADLGSEISKRKNKRIIYNDDTYLKEPGISKLQKKIKRMSFN